MKRGFGLGTVAVALGLSACATTDNPMQRRAEAKPQPPAITEAMELSVALEAAVDYGGDTLVQVRRLIKNRKEGDKAAKTLEAAIRDGAKTYDHYQLLNAGALYATSATALPVGLFKELIVSQRPLARQLGWQLAANKPAAAIAAAIDEELTRVVNDNDLDAVLMPQMANAVKANRLRGAYTVLRAGLMAKGHEEFALAMFEVAPERASDDMLPYLALAPAEELRQLTLSSVNLYTVLVILKQYQSRPPTVGAPGMEHLIVYAVSRNTALAELAQTVLEGYVPQHTEALAEAVARQPAWVQIAFLENARRRMTPNLSLLLTELKQATAENDVMREIDEIKM